MKYLIDTNVLSESAVNGLILVTRNVNDFNQFLRLKVQNWHSA